MKHLASLFKFVAVAECVEKYPKFGGLYSVNSWSETDGREKRLTTAMFDGDDVSRERLSAQRSFGIKTEKQRTECKNSDEQVTIRLGDIFDGLKKNNSVLECIVTTHQISIDQEGDSMLL